MKKMISFAAMAVVMSSPAFASKARLQALQKAEFLKDTQTVFINPAHLNSLNGHLAIEFGGPANTSSPKAEGGLFTEAFGGNAGIYLGHLNENQSFYRTTASYENQNNPIDLFYAKDHWGFSLSLSNFDDKTTKVKEQSIGLRAGADWGTSELFFSVDVISTAKNGNDELKSAPHVTVGYEKEMGTNYFFAKAAWGTGENKVGATTTDISQLGAEVGVISRRLTNVYYGTSLSYANLEYGKDISALTLPIFIGIEASLNSWAVVRASISQSVLISQTKDETQASPGDRAIVNKNDTTVSAGLGIKYNKFTLDGVIAGSTTGDLNGNDVLSQASLTYEF